MKRYCLVSGLCLCLFMGIFSCIPEAPEHKTEKDASAIVLDEDSDIIWRNFSLGCVHSMIRLRIVKVPAFFTD